MNPRPLFTAPIEEIGQSAIGDRQSAERAIVLYEDACSALAELKTIAEAKDVIDVAEAAIAFYTKVAKNKRLAVDAGELQLRAERRLGQMLVATDLSKGGRPKTGSVAEPVSAPTLAELGIDKKLSSRSQQLAAPSDERFEEMIEHWRAREESEAGRVSTRLVRDETKAERRTNREAELGAKIKALPERRFGVILADPEWRFEPRSRVTGMDRAPENHYPTSSLEELQRRRVADIAASDSVLFLWATVPMLAEAFCVLDAWGFASFTRYSSTGFLAPVKHSARYVSSAAWIKYHPGTGIGLGHWFRVDHEILLVATRGDPPAPTHGEQLRSVIDEPASRVHSEKPELVAEMIDRFWPTLPKIELNRRGAARPGWEAWGNEAEAAEC